MKAWKVLSLIMISHFLARNKYITQWMDKCFHKVMCSFVIFPLLKFVSEQRGWKSCFTWQPRNG